MYLIVSCEDVLPATMISDRNCKKMRKTCSELKSECSKSLDFALGSSARARKCKKALKLAKNKKVRNYCKKTCNHQCGKIYISIVTSTKYK